MEKLRHEAEWATRRPLACGFLVRIEPPGQTGRTPIYIPEMEITYLLEGRTSPASLFPQAGNKIKPILVTNNLY